MNKKTFKLVVYGSLRKDMYNHHLLKNSKLICTKTIKLPFEMVRIGSFPGLIPSKKKNDIVVEIYEVSPAVYGIVEILEGYPIFYNKYSFVDDEVGSCEIYILSKKYVTEHKEFLKGREHIEDWKEYYQKYYTNSK